MGGTTHVAAGYQISENACEDYAKKHQLDFHTMTSRSSVWLNTVRHLSEELGIKLYLLDFETERGSGIWFLAYHVEQVCWRVSDCDALCARPVPEQFSRLPEMIETRGEIRRVVGDQGDILAEARPVRAVKAVDKGAIKQQGPVADHEDKASTS